MGGLTGPLRPSCALLAPPTAVHTPTTTRHRHMPPTVMPGTTVKEHGGSDKAMVFSCVDFSEEAQKMELFCIRFASPGERARGGGGGWGGRAWVGERREGAQQTDSSGAHTLSLAPRAAFPPSPAHPHPLPHPPNHTRRACPAVP